MGTSHSTSTAGVPEHWSRAGILDGAG